ncbi:MAG: hypothetical protein P8N02_11555 [Actinomycetota bacterium]|nr:hypothetical protein [Actinomycetota bacterium]
MWALAEDARGGLGLVAEEWFGDRLAGVHAVAEDSEDGAVQ